MAAFFGEQGASPGGPIAVLADVHGNAWALEAVLADAARRGARATVNLGDAFYGPLDPARTARLLAGAPGLLSICGNQDRLLLEARASGSANPTLAFVLAELGAEPLDWLAGLPQERLAFGELFCCHGAPGDDGRYLLEDVSSGRPVIRPEAELAAMLAGIGSPVVLCGHSHLPGRVRLGDRLVVNPGGAGLPAYADDEPPHVMEAGGPQARYALLEKGPAGWEAAFAAVDYDAAAAAAAARERGRPDWATWLETGRARLDD